MDAIELLTLLQSNMQNQQNNMDFLTKNVNKKITAAMDDETIIGRLNKRDIITQLLSHEQSTNARKAVYAELEEWATFMLAEINKPQQ